MSHGEITKFLTGLQITQAIHCCYSVH